VIDERLDLQWLPSHRRRNEYQQVVGQPELQKDGDIILRRLRGREQYSILGDCS